MLWNNPFAKADRQQNTPAAVAAPNGAMLNDPNAGKTDKSGIVPNGNEDDPNTPKKEDGDGDDPMLKFDSLWEPNKDKDGNPIADDTNGEEESFLPKVDPKKFGELVNKMDFTKNITPQEWAAIKEGGDNAQAAIASILNKSNRHAFATMFSTMTKLVESGFKGAQGRFQSGVPDIVRDFMTEDGLMGDQELGPIFGDPALSPMVRGIKAQYLKKFPKATPSQVNGAVKQYFKHINDKLTGANKKNTQDTSTNQDKLRRGADDADFLAWIEKEVGGVGTQKADAQT